MQSDTDSEAALTLAAAQLALQQADAAHAEAAARLDNLDGRIADARRRIDDITRRRLAGEASESDTAELHALGYDVAALQAMRQEAGDDAARLQTALEAARASVAAAEADWHQHQATERLRALTARAQDLEGVLVACLTEIVSAALAAGHQSLMGVWQPSERLRTLATRTDLRALSGPHG